MHYSLSNNIPAPYFWLLFCLAAVSLVALFSISLASLFWLNICLAQFFSSLLSVTVSPHSLGLTFVSLQLFCLSSLSYSLAQFFWLNICLAPVFSLPSLSYSLAPFFWLDICLAPFNICLALPVVSLRFLSSPPLSSLL